MSDLEKDIKNIEQYINLVLDKGYCDCNELNVISTGKYCDGSKNVAYSMQNILAERKQDKQRIKELEEENTDLKIKNNSRIIGTYAEVKLEEILKEDYIPKQKLKDILQKNRNELFSITYLDKKQYEPYEKQIERINKIETELLEGE